MPCTLLAYLPGTGNLLVRLEDGTLAFVLPEGARFRLSPAEEWALASATLKYGYVRAVPGLPLDLTARTYRRVIDELGA